MAEPAIDVDYDRVTIEGVTILRPATIGVVQWFTFWDEYTGTEIAYQDGYLKGYRDGTRE